MSASAAIVPDTNGDGLDDLMVGAPARFSRRDFVYLILGKRGSQSVKLRDASRGVRRFTPARPGSGLGTSVGYAGDLDGDSLPELAMGAPGGGKGSFAAAETQRAAGQLAIIFGDQSGDLALESLGDGAMLIEGGRRGAALCLRQRPSCYGDYLGADVVAAPHLGPEGGYVVVTAPFAGRSNRGLIYLLSVEKIVSAVSGD